MREQIDQLLPPRADGLNHSFVEDDIVSADVLFPAWDFGEGRPILFSKTMAAHMNEKKPGEQPVYNANLNAGVLASAANVAYFGSANISWADSNGVENQTSVISGIAISESPALYAFMLATEYMEVPADKITITSVGSKTYSNDKISEEVNPLQWFSRLVQLTAPVKKYAQDFFVAQIMS